MPSRYIKISDEKDPILIQKRREKNRLKMRNWVAKYPEKAKAKRERQKERARILISKYKKECVRCGYNNPLALEFHHINPKDKAFTIGATKAYGYKNERLEEEIKKCIVLCCNCHRLEEIKKYG